MHLCILSLTEAWLAKLSPEMPCHLPRCARKDELSNTCVPYIRSFPSFVAIALLFALLSGGLLLSAPLRHHLQRHSSSLCFAHFTNLVAPKVSPSFRCHRSCPIRESRCLDPDFGLAPITFEVSIMDWYVAPHQIYQTA